MIDLHSHVLPGIDDGPATIEDSLALARVALAAGTRVLVATPHVNWRYRNDADTIARSLRELTGRLAAEGLGLELRGGAELAMTRIPDLDDAERSRLRLGEGRWLLVEPPFAPVIAGLERTLLDLQAAGYRIVIAHPERCAAFHRDPRLLSSLTRSGMLASITAGSLVGHFGEKARRFALDLAAAELVHNVASDAHDAVHRPPSIARELERAGLAPLAEWLTVSVPSAILSGEEIPARPAASLAPRASARRRWRRRG